MNDLNKKLLKWAGWVCTMPEYTDYSKDPPLYYEGSWRFNCEDGCNIQLPIPPDFTDPDLGIAHCFKWLVPKLKPKKLIMETYYEGAKLCYSVTVLSEKQSGGIWSGNDKDPALALCKAIEKLIDGRAK